MNVPPEVLRHAYSMENSVRSAVTEIVDVTVRPHGWFNRLLVLIGLRRYVKHWDVNYRLKITGDPGFTWGLKGEKDD